MQPALPPQRTLTQFVVRTVSRKELEVRFFNPINAELNPICNLLALLGAHHILHVRRVRVKRCPKLGLMHRECSLFSLSINLSTVCRRCQQHRDGTTELKLQDGMSQTGRTLTYSF